MAFSPKYSRLIPVILDVWHEWYSQFLGNEIMLAGCAVQLIKFACNNLSSLSRVVEPVDSSPELCGDRGDLGTPPMGSPRFIPAVLAGVAKCL